VVELCGNKVLVVDDETRVRSAISTTLQSRGYAVATAADGNEALAAIRSDSPDLMLLDLAPETDGFRVLKTLQTGLWWKYSKIPTIVLNPAKQGACRRCYQIERSFELGAEDYLEKPIQPEALIDVVGKAFDRHYG
jgi:CheY-like chemotaxis protein